MRILSFTVFAMKNLRLLIFAILLILSVPVFGQDNQKSCAQQIKDLEQAVTKQTCRKKREHPTPPRLPRNFSWKGRYVVPDIVDPRTGELGIDVPFTWSGNNGNVQMIAGSENDPIYFTNFIYQNHLYTYTYKWPGLQPPFLPPLESCAPLLKFTLEDLNALLATATYVESLILDNGQRVNHFRLPIVTPPLQPPGFYLRLPLILGDFFVDSEDPEKIWQVLHFGIQNIYAPHLDEWIFIHKFKNSPGKIILPPACCKKRLGCIQNSFLSTS